MDQKEQMRVERIRHQYMERNATKIEQLQRLDEKVKLPGQITASMIGVVGALTMGAGMSLVMVWENMTIGLILGIPGLLISLVAYPIYNLILNNRKKKYASEILRLSDEIIRRRGIENE